MSTNPRKQMGNMVQVKTCPFAAAQPQQKNSDCLGESCACYVKLNKRQLKLAEHSSLPDQEFHYCYSGCGLVTRIPWELVKPKETQKEELDNRAQNSVSHIL
jgi:hypothetical protein